MEDVGTIIRKYRKYIVFAIIIAVILGAIYMLLILTKPTAGTVATQTGNTTTYTIGQGSETMTVSIKGTLITNSTETSQQIRIIFKRYVLYINDTPAYYLMYQVEINITYQNMKEFQLTMIPAYKYTVGESSTQKELGLEYDDIVEIDPNGGTILKQYILYVSSAYNFVYTVYGGFTNDWYNTTGTFFTELYISATGSLSGLTYSLHIDSAGEVYVKVYYKVEMIIIQFVFLFAVLTGALVFVGLRGLRARKY